MKRDARLHGLTTDHHHALRLAWDVRHATPSAELAARVGDAFHRELLPHFDAEERLLLPLLRARGEGALADRTLHEHARLRALVAAVAEAPDRLPEFAETLTAHVRFEEGELFPAAERVMTDGELEAVARHVPKERPRGGAA